MAALFKTSGATAKATTDNNPVEVIAAYDGGALSGVTIINEGGVAGFFSIDGGIGWGRLSANVIGVTLDRTHILNEAIQVKRIADSTDLSGIWGFAWGGRT